jgi:hypothetical protein
MRPKGNNKGQKRIVYVIYSVFFGALALHLKTAFIDSSDPLSIFSIVLLVWSLTPYILIMIIILQKKWLYETLCAVIAVFSFDLWMHLEVFMFPKSSTAAIGLLFMPLLNLIFVIPISLLIVFIIRKKSLKKV